MLFKNLKAQVSYSVLTAFSICLIAGGAQAAEIPTFTPVNGWEVAKTDLSNVRGLGGMKLPCVITTQYDNGYVVRLSGGGGNLLAMAVDFRQTVFQKGRKYPAMISVGDDYIKQVSASAFNASTLIFNLRPLNDFYGVVKSGADIEIGIDANSMKFAAGDLVKALGDLEGCYTGTKEAPVPMTETLRSANAEPAKDAPMPIVPPAKVEAQELKVADKAAAPAPVAAPAAAPAPAALPPAVAAKELPRTFDEIISEGKEDVPVVAEPKAVATKTASAPAAPVVPKEVAPVEKADVGMSPMPGGEDVKIAAQVSPQVEAQPAAKPMNIASARANTVSRGVAAPTITPATLPPVAAPRVAAAPTPPPAPAPVIPTWNAKAGEDMKIVLSRWAERAGYDLQWESGNDGKVAQDMTFNGSFEEAVGQLLAENSAASGIAGHVQTASGTTKEIASKAMPDAPEPVTSPATQASIPAYHTEWSAPAGANIQTILDQWAAKAGVNIVWQSYMSVPLKAPVNVNGSFEQAVESLLDQYNNDASRPVAQLNIDPDTGQRTLLMNLDKSV